MKWPTKKLGEVLDYEQPTKYLVSSTGYKDEFSTPVLTAGKTFILGNTNEKRGIFPEEKLPVIIFDDFTTATKFVDFPFKVKSSAMKILHAKKGIADAKYLFYLIQTIKFSHKQHKRYWISEYSQLEIPFPPIEEQKRIVKKIENIFAKIDEASRLREESSIDAAALLPSAFQQIFSRAEKRGWVDKTLGDLFEITSSKRVFKSEWTNNGVPFYRAREIVSLSKGKPFKTPIFISERMYNKYKEKYGVPKNGDILVTGVGTIGISYVVKKNDKFYFKDGNIIWLKKKSGVDSRFIEYFFKSSTLKEQIKSNFSGATVVGTFTITTAKSTKISVPPEAEQKKIVAYLDSVSQKSSNLENIQRETATDFYALRQSILASAFAQ
ncbi:MAG: restriction endonuclease subunit S [Candidatus Paceibacterota bacterium]